MNFNIRVDRAEEVMWGFALEFQGLCLDIQFRGWIFIAAGCWAFVLDTYELKL